MDRKERDPIRFLTFPLTLRTQTRERSCRFIVAAATLSSIPTLHVTDEIILKPKRKFSRIFFVHVRPIISIPIRACCNLICSYQARLFFTILTPVSRVNARSVSPARISLILRNVLSAYHIFAKLCRKQQCGGAHFYLSLLRPRIGFVFLQLAFKPFAARVCISVT